MCNLGDTSGSEQKGYRPCLIISNNLNNKYSNIVIIVPITSRDKKDLPMHYVLYNDKYSFFNSKKNTVLTEQIRCIGADRLGRKLGRIDVIDLMHVIQKLNINFKDIELY